MVFYVSTPSAPHASFVIHMLACVPAAGGLGFASWSWRVVPRLPPPAAAAAAAGQWQKAPVAPGHRQRSAPVCSGLIQQRARQRAQQRAQQEVEVAKLSKPQAVKSLHGQTRHGFDRHPTQILGGK